ncbi:unnamed protein product [Clonostachys chloroleuca]|uniref:Major facilitator superfamily (MFS) profile domain-containing protein n=1 Tax=Clonostachys chloroleuca TaxID=1926264 RepID=A0AA35M7X2_9HYPO|nr:unnamed protein product [Clonostachys chloroleuca]
MGVNLSRPRLTSMSRALLVDNMLHHQKHGPSQDLGVIGNNFIELSDSGTSYRPDQADDVHPLNDADNVEDPDDSLPLSKAARKYPKVVAYSLSLMLVVLGWGYDLVLVGSIPAVDSFKRDYGEMYKDELIIPAMWLSLWTAASPLGMAVGSLFAGWFQDIVGRRMSLFTGSGVTGVGAAIILCSYLPPDIEAKRGMFFAGKLIQGLSVGLLKVTAMTYILCGAKIRRDPRSRSSTTLEPALSQSFILATFSNFHHQVTGQGGML